MTTTTGKKLVGYRAIAAFIAEHEGRSCSTRTARRYAATEGMPTRYRGQVVAIAEEVAAWLDSRERPSRFPRGSKPATQEATGGV
jgi:hypothetical protein